jgi:hypothetical protein
MKSHFRLSLIERLDFGKTWSSIIGCVFLMLDNLTLLARQSKLLKGKGSINFCDVVEV